MNTQTITSRTIFAATPLHTGKDPVTQELTASKERKIVIVGDVGSGKSTAIRTISEVPVIGSDAQNPMGDKSRDLVTMKYGVMHMANLQVNLYTAPGQKRFDFLENVLCQEASGILILINGSGLDPLGDIDHYLKLHSYFLETSPAVIAVTHFDEKPASHSLLAYQAQVYKNGYSCPVMLLDARDKQEVRIALKTLVGMVDDFHISINQMN